LYQRLGRLRLRLGLRLWLLDCAGERCLTDPDPSTCPSTPGRFIPRAPPRKIRPNSKHTDSSNSYPTNTSSKSAKTDKNRSRVQQTNGINSTNRRVADESIEVRSPLIPDWVYAHPSPQNRGIIPIAEVIEAGGCIGTGPLIQINPGERTRPDDQP